jgi:DNA-binding IclR family transcriptional regulator
VQSVARAVAILGAVAESVHGLRAMEIAARLGLGRQATYHLLHTLVGSGMLARNQQNRYVLGLHVATLADAFVRQLEPPEHLAPLVRAVAAETGETAYTAGWRDGEIVSLVSVPGSNPIQAVTAPQGYSRFAHARATGKLLLAYATPELRERYFATHALDRCTANTLTDRVALDAELARIREEGASFDREEFAPGLCCLAVPVGRTGATFAIGLSAPVERFQARCGDYLRIMRRIAQSA